MPDARTPVSTCLLWLRRDLRLADNPALRAACREYDRVVVVYVFAPEEEGAGAPGGASRWWLHHSLFALNAALRTNGGGLVIRRGPTQEALRDLCRDYGACAVYWNRVYEPDVVARDRAIKAWLPDIGVAAKSFNAGLLHEPWAIATGKGEPYRVFTPFWKACRAIPAQEMPEAAPSLAAVCSAAGERLTVADLDLLPHHDWGTGLASCWQPGEDGAHDRLRRFLDHSIADYAQRRDIPAADGTSCLSPYLHFGEIGPRQILQACRNRAPTAGGDAFERQLYWREFAHHLLFHFPDTARQALDRRFDAFPWENDARDFDAWRLGRTGVPIVDAGLRELWQTGWMHNRVRMIVASLLSKNLLVSWQRGAAWFHDTLVDADLACNTLGWQWTAGCGADAAPYFRIFNPVLQGERFDGDGAYVGRWVPELAAIPVRWRHRPWDAPALELERAGVVLGRDYPLPCVDLKASRVRALSAWDALKAR